MTSKICLMSMATMILSLQLMSYTTDWRALKILISFSMTFSPKAVTAEMTIWQALILCSILFVIEIIEKTFPNTSSHR